jgi:outer membrane lipoprotein-sorting protein
MLAEKVVSTGMFYLRADHRVRLEYLKPFKYLMIITGDKITIQDNSRTTEMDMHRSKLFSQVNQIITGTMQGGMLDNADFECGLSENSTQYRVNLMPKTKGLKQFFKSIIIFIDKRDMTADRLEMHEPGGDYTMINFTDKILNGKIPDSRFVVTR